MRQSITLHDRGHDYPLKLSSFELEFPHLQTYQCSVILSPPVTPYDDDDLQLILMAIKSHPRDGLRRSAVRQTWAQEQEMKGYKLRRLFLVGRTESSAQMEILKVESSMYGDILQWDMMEGHYNLSLKERCFLEWMNHQVPEVDYIFKGDDDVFVNPELVVDLINVFGSPDIIHGYHQHRPPVMRSTKYRITEDLYPVKFYPGFVSGGGFIFSGPSVPILYESSRVMPVFPLDDVYFGFLALAANLTYRHDHRFYVRGLKYDVCTYKEAIVVHGIGPERLINIWSEVTKHKCDKDKG
ncbi:N-acetyllactosaminide beta-1,3-N-acetylglucosaminyltransferase 2-like [Bufo gargarizans]|uniref:N-acetyllactosaminide beta-1,3-N-acetylglucosaminyltransferase 2-like n=1 Tax=Bufo gargarizans TaxID=30331 RepID=UPI001CF41FD2|nr:N-acetyllactosaminide beta-1,3-N-acetylglucosaminyltransferase 2-like [Bufo gargarizans]